MTRKWKSFEESMDIQREKYLNDLLIRRHNGLIKVITGIRRVGKSYLLFNHFKKQLLDEGIKASQIIEIALDQRKWRELRDPDRMLGYVESRMTEAADYYIFIDEVQMLVDFEEVLATWLARPRVDIYITGSNSRFLSNDVITAFRGRGDEVHILPLTFSEFMSVYSGDVYHGWRDYVTYGGLPLTVTMPQEQQKIAYLKALFKETYLKDIHERYRIDKKVEFNDLINVLASAVGSLTNPTKLVATFKSKLQSAISTKTVSEYIEYLKDAFVINEAQRFDVKGRKHIGTPVKYYFEDVGLRNARIGFRQTEETHLMENVLYNELRYRGFEVDVGVVPVRERNKENQSVRSQFEIDFVATLGSRKYYIQSALNIPDLEKENQEKRALRRVADSFKKIIVVKDVIHVQRDEDGITTMSLYDFLLKKNSLEL